MYVLPTHTNAQTNTTTNFRERDHEFERLGAHGRYVPLLFFIIRRQYYFPYYYKIYI